MTSITFFPNEILFLIMMKLDPKSLYTCTLVSRIFYAAANLILWRSVHPGHQAQAICFLYCLARARSSVGRWIRQVHLSHRVCLTDTSLMVLMHHAPLLQTLIMENATQITDTSLKHVLHYMPYLESLHLSNSPITHVSYHILGKMNYLTSLELWNCPGLEANTFSMHFADSNLENLMLAAFVPMDEEDERETRDLLLVDESTIDLTRLSQLSYLKIHGPPFGMLQRPTNTTTPSFWRYLNTIILEACFDMSDAIAMRLIRDLLPPGLVHLGLRDSEFGDATLALLAVHQPNLVELDVSSNHQISSRGIRRLVHQCRQLSLVKLSYCDMKMQDFPEAGPHCAGEVVTYFSTFMGLDHLDHQAIEAIRRVPDFDDNDDYQMDHGEVKE